MHARRAPRSHRARRRARGCARRAGRAACAPDGRSRAPWRRRPGVSRTIAAGSPSCSSRRAHDSTAPRITGPAPRMPAATAPCSELRIGGERHPGGDVRGHEPVLGDRHQQEIEEEALVLGRLAAGEQQVEVLREGQPAHQVAGEVASPHLDPVRIGLADATDCGFALELRHRFVSCHGGSAHDHARRQLSRSPTG